MIERQGGGRWPPATSPTNCLYRCSLRFGSGAGSKLLALGLFASFVTGSFAQPVVAMAPPSTFRAESLDGVAVNDPLLARSLVVRDDVLGRVADARALIEQGSLEGALRATVKMRSGYSFHREPEIAPQTPHLASIIEAVPSQMKQSIAMILSSFTRASDVLRRHGPDLVVERHFDLPTLAHLEEGLPEPVLGPQASVRAMLRPLIRRRVPTRPTGSGSSRFVASLTIATAIDRALPRIVAYADDHTPTAKKVSGCDLVDQLPLLCIGGSGNNHYEDDAALLIDLGGEDSYSNSAGGADAPMPAFDMAISVNIDVAGDDKYAAQLPLTSGSRVAQGAALDGGIGLLLDLQGDDLYSVSSSEKTKARSFGAIGQGSALSGGVGILLDASGDDRYRVTSTDLVRDKRREGAHGIGVASSSGIGVLVDLLGDDSYLVEAKPAGHVTGGALDPGDAVAKGFGAGLEAGVGVFFDGAGDDKARLRAITLVPPGYSGSLTRDPAGALALGFGSGRYGTGIALSGAGDAQMLVDVQTSVPTHKSGAAGYGFGVGIGDRGVFEDIGGDDSYAIRASDSEHVLVWPDGACHCATPRVSRSGFCSCDDRVRRGSSQWPTGPVSAGMGFGASILLPPLSKIGVGVMRDLSGNDVYAAKATATSRVRVVEGGRRATFSALERWIKKQWGAKDPPPTIFSAPARSSAQGVGQMAGIGVLNDDGGDDSYASDAAVKFESSGASTFPGMQISAASPFSLAQGFGYDQGFGGLWDHGGGDSYSSDNKLAGAPKKENEFIARSLVQASVAGGVSVLYDLDDGQGDSFLANPENPACYGVRGQGQWRDCGQIRGTGWVINVP